MGLKIKKDHIDLIKAFGEDAFPNECCGFLLGRQNGTDKEVLSTFPAMNAREEGAKYHRFLITPEAYLQCEKYAKERDMDVIGFYHSHPNADARPSAYDLEHSWPWYSYVIVSIKDRKAEEVTSWILQDDREKLNQEKLSII